MKAADQAGEKLITVSGGVSCNLALREAMQQACKAGGKQLLIAPPHLSTDNAAMIAFVALQYELAGIHSDIKEDINPNLALVH